MDAQDVQQSPGHQTVMDRFVAACRDDERVVAAFLAGSLARGAADAYSDLDLGLITTDEDALSVEQLAPLRATCCSLESGAMLRAALAVVRCYRDLAPRLACAHGIVYPDQLKRMMCDRLQTLCNALLA